MFVRGNDMNELKRLSDELVARISAIPGAVDVGTSLTSGQPEMVAHVDRARAADMGFSVGSVAMQLRNMVEGVVPGKLREQDHEFDIRVRLAPGVPQRLRRDCRRPDLLVDGRRRARGRSGDDGAGRRAEFDRSRAARAAGQDRRGPAWARRSAT